MEHESALRCYVDLVSLNVCQHCSCTSVHILCIPANVVTSALAQVFSTTVIHGIESQHSFNLLFSNQVKITGSVFSPGGNYLPITSYNFQTVFPNKGFLNQLLVSFLRAPVLI